MKRRVLGGEAVSAICEELTIAPNQFYRCQKELFDHAAAAFLFKGSGKILDSRTRKLSMKVDSL